MPPGRAIAGAAAALLVGIGGATALAEPPPSTTVDTTITTVTTAPTTTTTTTVPETTTTSESTQSTTTTPAPRTTTNSIVATPAHELVLARSCPLGGVVLLLPNRAPVVVGPIADARTSTARFGGLNYPADGSIVTATSVALHERACGAGSVQLQAVSLLGGVVNAARVTLELGAVPSASIAGLTVGGKRVSGSRVPLPWGYLVTGAQTPVQSPDGARAFAALTIHLVHAHAGLPAGTTILVAAAGTATSRQKNQPRAVAHRRRKHSAATHQPLTVTPPLGQRHYIFPVVGSSDYVDTYGAFRSDVPGNWHHGDDIFAPLGAPVVAVASGTINRVGWEKLGGWRLWVRDGVGDEFYYAHLSGYAPTDLHSNRVKAGEVIGFIGNTGDAFTTSPHLHFEIHPRPLLHLGYDGAVDPTTYLNGWTHVEHVNAPIPTHPPLPGQPLLRNEARYVFRELLAARHLIRRAPSLSRRPRVLIPAGANGAPIAAPAPLPESAPPSNTRTGDSTLTVALLTGLGSGSLFALSLLMLRFRGRFRRPKTD